MHSSQKQTPVNRNAETRVLGLFRQASCLSHYLQFDCFDLADEAGGVVDEVVGDNFEHGVTEATNVEDVLTLHRMDRLAQLVPPPPYFLSPQAHWSLHWWCMDSEQAVQMPEPTTGFAPA